MRKPIEIDAHSADRTLHLACAIIVMKKYTPGDQASGELDPQIKDVAVRIGTPCSYRKIQTPLTEAVNANWMNPEICGMGIALQGKNGIKMDVAQDENSDYIKISIEKIKDQVDEVTTELVDHTALTGKQGNYPYSRFDGTPIRPFEGKWTYCGMGGKKHVIKEDVPVWNFAGILLWHLMTTNIAEYHKYEHTSTDIGEQKKHIIEEYNLKDHQDGEYNDDDQYELKHYEGVANRHSVNVIKNIAALKLADKDPAMGILWKEWNEYEHGPFQPMYKTEDEVVDPSNLTQEELAQYYSEHGNHHGGADGQLLKAEKPFWPKCFIRQVLGLLAKSDQTYTVERNEVTGCVDVKHIDGETLSNLNWVSKADWDKNENDKAQNKIRGRTGSTKRGLFVEFENSESPVEGYMG